MLSATLTSVIREPDLRNLHSFPTRRSSDLFVPPARPGKSLQSRLFRIITSRRSCSAAIAAAATYVRAAASSTRFAPDTSSGARSEEHTSELQSHSDLVCRLLLEKKNAKSRA